MAGAEFKKYAKGSIGDAGHYAHYDNAVRGDPRTHHDNVHIDVTKTHLNYYIGTTGWEETRRRIDARMERADAEHPPQRVRKDRVGFYSLNVKCPPELENTEQEAEFFKKSYELACEVMSSVEGAFVHKDEKHTYKNSDTKEMTESRYEMHIFGAAITDDGRLNGKQAICPEKCKEINDKMQAMCLKEFGISYQTGEGRKGKKKRTVEQVEAMGVVQDLEQRAKNAKAETKTEKEHKYKLQNDVLDLQGDIFEKKKMLRDLGAEKAEAETTLTSLRAEIVAKRNEVEALETAKTRIKSDLQEWINEHRQLQNILNASPRLSERNRNKLETLREREVERVGKIPFEMLDSVDDILNAADELERGAKKMNVMRKAAKENLDVDDLLDGEIDLC